MINYIKTLIQNRKNRVERSIIEKSDQPWIKNLTSDPTDDVTLLYDWNKAFIEKLRAEGIVGETDLDVMQAWHKKQQKIKLEEQKQKELKARKESDEPWVIVVGEKFETDAFDGQTNIGLTLDWNKAFIKLLKSKGFTGRSEDEMVEKWLVTLNRNLLQNPETGYD